MLLRILDEFKQAGRQQMDLCRLASEFQYYYFCSVCVLNINVLAFSVVFLDRL
jgi:hypothetical protein